MIRTIIAPVDFSYVSLNALAFAAELTKRAKARLIVFHALEEVESENEAKLKLKNVETDLRRTLGAGTKYECLTAKGDFVTALQTAGAFQQPDLIVMGTKGATGLKRIFIGSNTVNVMENVKLPVLVIPEAAGFERFNNRRNNRIVLATDLEELENDKALDILKAIALFLNEPKIRVLNVRREGTSLDFNKGMERAALISRFQPEIEADRATIFGNSVVDGINYYLDKNDDTGLVAMVARDSGQLIQKHHTHEMASITRYPLLVLHDTKR
jgi:nucleotide-binding universal stress UspA family protein